MNDMKERCVVCQEMKSRWGMNGYGQCSECAKKVEDAQRAQSGLKSDWGAEADAALDAACASFPATFRLRAHEGIFRVNRRNSYVSRGRIYVYTDKLRSTQVQSGPSKGQYQDEWVDFAKGTVEELQTQIRPL